MDKKYDQLTFDPKAQEKWASEQTYAYQEKSEKKTFSIDTPPPTVSGKLHIGHVFSYTQTDIIARFKRMSGYNVFYPFGFDNNGLATERFVEKKHKVTGFSMNRSDFITLCLKESEKSQEEFQALWERLGLSADWNRTYSTIGANERKLSQQSFMKLHQGGNVYQKEEPALYCTTCFTSVAQAELDDVSSPSQFNDITFKSKDGSDLVIATTRPELLPSCVALFFHPEDDRYKHLKDQTAIVPMFGHEVPILADETVEQGKGTGLVMCCTFGDKNDIAWFKKYKLPYRQSIGFNGKFTEETGVLAGLKAHIAREKIIEELKKIDVLSNQKAIEHSVNVHERCKKPIEYVVLKQWFLNILDHKQEFLDQADKIDWHPSFMKARYRDWVENLGWDWCLSRQRFYGIPFPAWHCTKCAHVEIAPESMLPVDPQETDCPVDACSKCGATEFRPDTDVMDTWNTSSITPYITAQLASPHMDNPFEQAHAENFLPMSMRPQAHDIIRTWAFYTIIKAYLHNKTLPWKEIVISGHVLSPESKKISKSAGNNPMEPENLLKLYPADAIRYWTASGNLGHDISFSESQLKVGCKLLTKLWNAFRFIKEHMQGAPTEQPENLSPVNEWLLHRIDETFKTYNSKLEQHEFGLALHSAERFFWADFCDNYLEIIKDQLFKPENYNAQTIAATRWTLNHVGTRILQLFAPYLPHATETIYGEIFTDTKSLHATEFKTFQTTQEYKKSAQLMDMINNIVGVVRKLKSEKQLSLKTDLEALVLHSADQELLKTLVPHEQLLKGVTRAQIITYNSGDIVQPSLECSEEKWTATLDLDDVMSEKES